MFDFQKLSVYQKALQLNEELFRFFETNKFIDRELQSQIKRAAISVALNIAEGTGRTSKGDKAHFYTIARGSAFELAAGNDLIAKIYPSSSEKILTFNYPIEEIARMLCGLISNTSSKWK